MTEIGSWAFKGCTKLKKIYCHIFLIDYREAFDKSLVHNITLHVPKHVLGENGFFIACNQCTNICIRNRFKKIVPIEAKVKKIELPTKIYLSGKNVHLLDQTITPSYATEQRDYRIFEDFAYHLVAEARSKSTEKIFGFDGHVYAFDSTTIDLCLEVFEIKYQQCQ